MFKGKKVALVLTGGGGRCIAHAGVIKACEKMDIKFDLIIGASAGALCAVWYSIYNDAERIVDNFRPARKRKYKVKPFGWRNFITTKKFFSRNFKSGLFDLSNGEKFFADTLPINNFDELPIPTYVSVTNLDRNEGILIGPNKRSHIPISKALVASCCIPVLFRPIEIDGEYYVDGEIKRPLSINEAVELGADVIIVSDIYTPNTINIGKSSMFNIGSQIANMMLGDKSKRGIKICEAKYPDKKIILISPPVGSISALNTYAYDKLSNTGYNTAIRILREVENES